MSGKFLVTISIPIEIDFQRNELFVDPNPPENPTLDDVLALIKKDGGPRHILDDWNMMDDFLMDVTVRTDAGTESATLDASGNVCVLDRLLPKAGE